MAEPKKRLKCKKRGPWCFVMDSQIHNDGNSTRAGLSEVIITNFASGKTFTAGILHRKKASAKGTFLNFCPWCGADIQPKG